MIGSGDITVSAEKHISRLVVRIHMPDGEPLQQGWSEVFIMRHGRSIIC